MQYTTFRSIERTIPPWLVVALISVLIAGILATGWMVTEANRQMRNEFLQQARLVANALNFERIQSLTGSKDDLNNPDYMRLTEQLTAITRAGKKYVYVYLLGRNARGDVFIFAESAPRGSEHPLVPGELYEETSVQMQAIFDNKTPFVEGPLPDDWGIWVSALAPIKDPKTGTVVAVLGVDIDAKDWKWALATQAALPVGMTGAMLILLVMGLFMARSRAGLRESEEKFRALADSIPTAVLLYQDNRYLYANRAAEEISGYAYEEILGMNFWDFVHPDYQVLAREQGRKRRRDEGTPIRYELKLVTKRGVVRWADISEATILVEGNPAGIVSVTDITERRQAEEELRESRELYARLTDTIPDVIIRTDLEGNITFVNDHAIDISGYSRDELEGRNVLNFVVHEDRDRLTQNEKRMMKRRLGPTQYRLIMKDGRTVPFEVNGDVLHDKEGTPCGTVHVLRDITARKKSEEMLRQSEEKFSKIFMLSPDCIAITRLTDGMILDVNHGFEEITGWKREAVIGETSFDILFWIGSADRDFMVNELTSGREVLHREFQFQRKDGALRRGTYSARSIHIAGDACLLFSMRDITEWRQLQEDRQKLEQQLSQAQKMEAIGTLAGGIAHDFNNILSAIMGYAELCLHMADDRAKVRTFMEQTLKAAERAKDLVQQILTFSRKVEHEKRPILLTPIIKEIVKFMRASLPTTIEIRQTIDGEADAIMADPIHMHQVLMNLCTNAGHAMNESGGVLEIGLKEVAMNGKNSFLHTPPKAETVS